MSGFDAMRVETYRRALGLYGSATLDDVNRCYRSRMLQAHPDRGGDEATARLLNEARDFFRRHPEEIARVGIAAPTGSAPLAATSDRGIDHGRPRTSTAWDRAALVLAVVGYLARGLIVAYVAVWVISLLILFAGLAGIATR